MSYCSKCGKEVAEDSSFCGNCGEKIKDQETASPVVNKDGSYWLSLSAFISSVFIFIATYDQVRTLLGRWLFSRDDYIATIIFVACSLIMAIVSLLKKARGKGFAVASIIINLITFGLISSVK